jgi:hypothetical protein
MRSVACVGGMSVQISHLGIILGVLARQNQSFGIKVLRQVK